MGRHRVYGPFFPSQRVSLLSLSLSVQTSTANVFAIKHW